MLWLTLDEIKSMHRRQLEMHGGTPGILNYAMLESACHRPQTPYFEEIWACAAAYLQGLATAHAFCDGNKRVAWVAMRTFLFVNGYHLIVPYDEGEDFVIGVVIEGRASIPAIAEWIQQRAQKVLATSVSQRRHE